MTIEQARERFLHSLNVKKEMIKAADERLKDVSAEFDEVSSQLSSK